MMCKGHEEINRRMGRMEGDIHSLINDNNQSHADFAKESALRHAEIFKRITTLEITMAKAHGAKSGVIFAFSMIWAVVVAAVAGAWKWIHG